MTFKRFIFVFFGIFSCYMYAQTEYTETVPPSVFMHYEAGQQSTIMLAIGHKPVGKKDSFAGFYYEKDAITNARTVTSLGVIAFNFSRQETLNDGGELRIGLSETNHSGQQRKGLDFGLKVHKYVSQTVAIGIGGIIRPAIFAYRSDEKNTAEYKASLGAYYSATDYLKLSIQYQYDGIILEDITPEYVNDGFQFSLSLLF